MRPKVKVLLAFIPLSFILSSCQKEDLSALKPFGELALSLASANKTISADIYASCARSSTWMALGTQESRGTSEKGLKVCQDIFLPNSQNTEKAGRVLVNYVTAVGNLATGNNNFTPQFNQISEGLGILGTPEARTAGVKIADFITNLLVRDFRRDNLKLAILCTDQDIQKYSASLSDFIESSYVKERLNKEIEEIYNYHGFYISEVNIRLQKLSDSQDDHSFKELQERQTLLESEERAEINKVIQRRTEASDYVAVIRSTAEFHGKLKRIFNNNREELSLEQIKKCNKYRSTNESVSAQGSDKKYDSWNQEITSSELKQVKEVSKKYIDKVIPLLNAIPD